MAWQQCPIALSELSTTEKLSPRGTSAAFLRWPTERHERKSKLMSHSSHTLPPPATTRPSRAAWSWIAFSAINAVILAVFFWPAIRGSAMLAPLDVAPNFFSKFRYIDPNATGVPMNHYIVDLMYGDLPRNVLVYDAWQRGEMPWWDPYTDSGKPLAAEANAVNVSDPVKAFLFHALHFESAYNWARIIPFLLSGLIAFALLRQLGIGFSGATWGALLYEFAGCNIIMFSGPTAQASFAYYPLLWLLWHLATQRRRGFWFGMSTLVASLIFLSGNLQSHSYAFLFALAFLIGYGWNQRERWRFLLCGLTGSLILGLSLASPFVLPQVELYFLSARKLQGTFTPLGLLSGVVSAITVYPWGLGTFRTLDLSKVFAQPLLGFWIYIGSAAFIIAIIGATLRTEPGTMERDVKRTALALIAIYFIICSTPLVRIFYTRTAWLAVLGLIVLFASGWTLLCQNIQLRKAWAIGILLIAGVAVLACNIGGGVIYPKIESKVEARFLEAQKTNPALDYVEPLRRFQVRNFTNEVTFKNPETVLAFLGLVALGLFMLRPVPWRAPALNAILIVSTMSLLLFAHRYIPMHSMALWDKLRAGGTEQQRVVAELQPEGLRLLESAPGMHEWLFPGALSQMFRVHSMNGYSSLMLNNAGFLRDDSGNVPTNLYDYKYVSALRGLERGALRSAGHKGQSRFQWVDGMDRNLTVKNETLNTLTLTMKPSDAADLIRTDAYYPGWRAFAGTVELQVHFEPPCFSRIHIPAETTEFKFIYEPRHWRAGLWIAGIAGIFFSFWLLATFKRPRMT
jgi:hypothetical protein